MSDKVKDLDVKLTNIQKDVDDIKTYLSDNRQFGESDKIITLEKIMEQYSLSFPMNDYDTFKAFDDNLIGDLYEDLVNDYLFYIATYI